MYMSNIPTHTVRLSTFTFESIYLSFGLDLYITSYTYLCLCIYVPFQASIPLQAVPGELFTCSYFSIFTSSLCLSLYVYIIEKYVYVCIYNI
jgi:hypothetical protein